MPHRPPLPRQAIEPVSRDGGSHGRLGVIADSEHAMRVPFMVGLRPEFRS